MFPFSLVTILIPFLIVYLLMGADASGIMSLDKWDEVGVGLAALGFLIYLFIVTASVFDFFGGIMYVQIALHVVSSVLISIAFLRTANSWGL